MTSARARTSTAVRGCMILVALFALQKLCSAQETNQRTQIERWGTDHIGKPLPDYVTGDECLFCHRKVGPRWPENSHQLTIRPASPDEPGMRRLRASSASRDIADRVQFVLGGNRQVHFLKRSSAYGKLDMLTVDYEPPRDQVLAPPKTEVAWNSNHFAQACAGCHTTAVDSQGAFSALSIDCYSCHGAVSLQHTSDTSLIFLSKKNRQPRQVVATCGQCHLRGGRSRTTGRPYPHNFVAGDNLFRDFDVDLSDDSPLTRDPIERHILENTRDVLRGGNSVSCVDCHDVHQSSVARHQELEISDRCMACHVSGQPMDQVRSYKRSSEVCGY